jgi:hypothetical protein
METEQSIPSDSEPSIESRLAAALGNGEPEVATDTEAPQEVAPDADIADDESEIETTDAEFVDVEDDAGETFKVPAKLKEAFLRTQDYSRKTAEVARLREAADDRIQYAEAREKLITEIVGEVAELKAVHAQMQQLQNIDLGALYNVDAGQALRVRDQRDALKDRMAQLQHAIQVKAQNAEATKQKHSGQQWEYAQRGFFEATGKISETENVEMAQAAQKLGFSDADLKGRLADSRVLRAIHLASKYLKLQDSKSSVTAAVSKAPPVVKPGAAVPGKASADQVTKLRQRLKTSGDVKDAQALLRRLM